MLARGAAMFERAYRQRLEADVARWQAEGVITPATGKALRNSLPPLGAGINIPVVVGIVGGLLIAAAFLAFVAANWTEIPRVLRFAMLLAGIAVAYGIGAEFARTGRPVLADLAASVGAIIFGAAIALVGQMYHLGDDFAAGLLLWAGGALAAVALTGSRGPLAVAGERSLFSRGVLPRANHQPPSQTRPSPRGGSRSRGRRSGAPRR